MGQIGSFLREGSWPADAVKGGDWLGRGMAAVTWKEGGICD